MENCTQQTKPTLSLCGLGSKVLLKRPEDENFYNASRYLRRFLFLFHLSVVLGHRGFVYQLHNIDVTPSSHTELQGV